MILNILILVILILLNGVLSASELAFLSIEKFELDKMIRKRKKNAKKIRMDSIRHILQWGIWHLLLVRQSYYLSL
mgnify:CR=1 FL=1